MLDETTNYKLLKLLEAQPQLSQRQLAQELGVSLGKVNFCLKALIEKGLLKATNFRNSKNKLAYMYLLTPMASRKRHRSHCDFLSTRCRNTNHWKLKSKSYGAKFRLIKPSENVKAYLECI